jgi:hypothetical protein
MTAEFSSRGTFQTRSDPSVFSRNESRKTANDTLVLEDTNGVLTEYDRAE